MAAVATSTDRVTTPVGIEDVAGVKSRVSWAAILGGAVIAIACYLVLTVLFAAIGLSLTEAGVRANAVGIGAVIAALVAVALSLFVGGWVSTQLSVGETTREAVIYGALVWAVVTAFTLGMVGMGMRAGYLALVSGAMVAQQTPEVQQKGWEQLAREAGVSDQKIAEVKAAAEPSNVRQQVSDPANQERAREGATIAAWSVFGGTVLSIAAAMGGALVGRGPQFRLFRTTTVSRSNLIQP
jgi:hypothetical protein